MKAVSIITACKSIEQIAEIKNLLVQELECYTLADQGFIMTMIVIQIIKLEEGTGNFDRFIRACVFPLFIRSTDN
jgi:hypothetical protein